MSFPLYEYLNANGKNEIQAWRNDLQVVHRAKLDEKLGKLYKDGEALRPHLLTDSKEPSVFKLRVQGPVKLRLLLCRGTVDMHGEYTLLFGTQEVGSVIRPKGAEKAAGLRREEVMENPNTRRASNAKYAKPAH